MLHRLPSKPCQNCTNVTSYKSPLGAAPYMKKGKGDTPKACAGRNKGKEKEERKKEKKEKKWYINSIV